MSKATFTAHHVGGTPLNNWIKKTKLRHTAVIKLLGNGLSRYPVLVSHCIYIWHDIPPQFSIINIQFNSLYLFHKKFHRRIHRIEGNYLFTLSISVFRFLILDDIWLILMPECYFYFLICNLSEFCVSGSVNEYLSKQKILIHRLSMSLYFLMYNRIAFCC